MVDAVEGVLTASEPVHPAHHALYAIAIALAQKLDEGAGMATAAVASELRATLADLLVGEERDDDVDRFIAGLSAPVGDASKA
ncbi:hypothetical protein ABT341_00290 [Pseudonocardia alni]|uniref:hypothetical protein n=1 Tax=Pseudonocardia alni TaxID=33907 RepID=UPI0033276CFB